LDGDINIKVTSVTALSLFEKIIFNENRVTTVMYNLRTIFTVEVIDKVNFIYRKMERFYFIFICR